MSDHPIIFSAPMVRALLDGRKTMTRRLAWRDAEFGLQDYASEQLEEMDAKGWNVVGEGNEGQFRVYKPTPWQRVKPGDRLWVKENFRNQQTTRILSSGEGARQLVCIDYDADGTRTHWNLPADDCTKILLKRGRGESGKQTVLLSCLNMPRIVSRLTLTVTAAKIERLQDISEADVWAEGMEHDVSQLGKDWAAFGDLKYSRPQNAFAALWNSLHGEGAWDANPEVVALTFAGAPHP